MKNILLVLTLIFTFASTNAQVRIIKVNPTNNQISLKNFGGSPIDVSSNRFCSLFSYATISTLNVVSGNLNMPAGDSVVISGFSLSNAADLGFYVPAAIFADTADMLDFVQWESAGNGRESVANSKGIWTSGNFVSGNPPYVFNGTANDHGVIFWDTTVLVPVPIDTLIRFVSIDPACNDITFKNFGSTTVDISGFRLCSEFSYTATDIGTNTTVVSGSLNLAPGANVRINGFAIDGTGADLSLYKPSGPFTDTAAMLDFVQWESAGNGRETEANLKGIWTAGNFVSGNSPYLFTGTGTQHGVVFWDTTVVIPPVAGKPNVRLLMVNPNNNTFLLKNFGTDTLDISNLRMCSKFIYTLDIVNDLTLEKGNLNMVPGDTVELSGFNLAASADLGLYKATGAFTDTAAMMDFVQWGSAGNGRESVANSKGIWTTGDFLSGTAPYHYVGNGNQNGKNFWTITTGIFSNLFGVNINLKLYPNPTSKNLNIDLANIDYIDLTLSIIDITGKQLFLLNNVNASNPINVSEYTNGVTIVAT